jgi:hypothetical protein
MRPEYGIEQIALEEFPSGLQRARRCAMREAVGDIIGMNLDPSHLIAMGQTRLPQP